MEKLFMLTMIEFLLLWIFIIVKVKFSMAKNLPVENLLSQNVWSIINYFIIIIIKTESVMRGRERVRALYQSEDPTPHNQPMEGRTQDKRVGAQRFCSTEKSNSEEAQTSAYEQPKHHE